MNRLLTLIGILALSAPAMAQISTDEARRRMAELNARAAASRPTVEDECARLLKENAVLRQQVTSFQSTVLRLQGEVDRLTQQIRTVQSAAAPATKPASKDIAAGMTLPEAEAIADNKATLLGTDSEGTSTYELRRLISNSDDGHEWSSIVNVYMLKVKGGKVASFQMHVIRDSGRIRYAPAVEKGQVNPATLR